MPRPHRALYRRGRSYIAVKRIRAGSSAYIDIGDEIGSNFPEWRLKSWYQRGMTGVVGDEWTEWKLAGLDPQTGGNREEIVAQARTDGVLPPAEPTPEAEGDDSGTVEEPEPSTETPKTEPQEGDASKPSKAAPKKAAAKKPSTRKASAKGSEST